MDTYDLILTITPEPGTNPNYQSQQVAIGPYNPPPYEGPVFSTDCE